MLEFIAGLAATMREAAKVCRLLTKMTWHCCIQQQMLWILFKCNLKQEVLLVSVHIFTVNESNYQICIQHGLVGLPEPKPTKSYNNVFDGLLSRLAVIREDDYVLMYILVLKN